MSFLIEQLLLPKSPAAPFFHLSLEGSKFDECWQPFLGGLFRAPMSVCYKASFESAELILAIGGNSAINGVPNLPVAVNHALTELLEQNRIEAFDFFWLVTDGRVQAPSLEFKSPAASIRQRYYPTYPFKFRLRQGISVLAG